ncbi:MAG: pentapeptide repeat-containing protein [Burkholderiales bacterium]|nr:pentapeptide repeat-containing protein [Burkholderiales bacterium]
MLVETAPTGTVPEKQAALRVGNREVVTDHYFHLGVENEPARFQNKVFVRLGARKSTVFRNVSFTHSVFDGCYLANCTFDSCDFTGCRFVGSNFHQSAFSGCKFWYAVFERTQIDDDILTGEAPAEENLRMRFARTLRMNFSQLGDAKAVNRAISLELEATEQYLRTSWSTKRNSYYRKKYPGWKQVWQFFRWVEFKLLDVGADHERQPRAACTGIRGVEKVASLQKGRSFGRPLMSPRDALAKTRPRFDTATKRNNAGGWPWTSP